jgi:hypothetical protein
MMMNSSLRKVILTAHIATSVGWFGAVTSFLMVSIVGLSRQETQLVRAIYISAEPITWYALVPLALASLITGIIQSLGTQWGLFRHYWVLFKLVLTILATLVLLQYTQTVTQLADVALETDNPNLDCLWSYLLHSAGALAVLLVATILSIFKPRGMTPYGWRKRQTRMMEARTMSSS